MKQLFERIITWGADKGIYDIEFDGHVQLGFLIEELHEVNKEFIAGNTDKAVGEICDLIVFSVNALSLLEYGDGILDWKIVYNISVNDKSHAMQRLVFAIQRISEYVFLQQTEREKKSLVNYYFGLIEICCNCIEKLGYSPEIALEETVKKIESRRGEFDSSIGKWVKEKGQADIYMPDYSIAKLEQ